jgi:NAD(P)-dependent dehydrogenase (short-subunit alcohol dehydrogenase family)
MRNKAAPEFVASAVAATENRHMSEPTRDLDGRTIVVTGANTGIGRATAEALGRRGARLLLAGRSREKTEPVVAGIRAAGGAAEFVDLDLGDLRSVRWAAAELLSRAPRVDVLVNNAGLAGAQGTTRDGFEVHFGVNHAGPFLLTNLLLPALAGHASRIVNVSSRAHLRAPGIDFAAQRAPTRSRTGFAEYGVSKLCNILFARELARRLGGQGVHAYALHPGVIASEIWRRLPWPLRPVLLAFMRSPEQGARTTLYCATSPDVAGDNGEYYEDEARKWPSRVAQRDDLARELWDRTTEWVGLAT